MASRLFLRNAHNGVLFQKWGCLRVVEGRVGKNLEFFSRCVESVMPCRGPKWRCD